MRDLTDDFIEAFNFALDARASADNATNKKNYTKLNQCLEALFTGGEDDYAVESIMGSIQDEDPDRWALWSRHVDEYGPEASKWNVRTANLIREIKRWTEDDGVIYPIQKEGQT